MSTPLTTQSTNLKNAVCWIGETLKEHPDKKREDSIREAELRFDLTPAECTFLDTNFTDIAQGRDCT
jgi:hypothetical protein